MGDDVPYETNVLSRSEKHLSQQERIDWLRLIRSENVGPVTFSRLLELHGNPREALKALPKMAKRGGKDKPLHVFSKHAAERELAHAEQIGATLICATEPSYPKSLYAFDGAPPCLYVRGHTDLLHKPIVGIVGARNASMSARRFAWNISFDLGNLGFVIASGLARGIDTAAHEGSLDTGTVAVMAGGLDIVYPPDNAELFESICCKGVAISEMPPGTEPQARYFPRRNRIIAGLSRGIVVVEAAVRSGSLITAKIANDQGRDIFAVPGSPLDPRSEGPNQLIRDGAILIRNANDVVAVLNHPGECILSDRTPTYFAAQKPPMPDEEKLQKVRHIIVNALSFVPVSVDEITRQCQLSVTEVNIALVELELANRIVRHHGGRVSKAV